MKNSPQPPPLPPLLLSSLCLQHRELTCGKRRNIQRLSRGCLSPTGVYFLPPRRCWEIKTLWTSHGPIEVGCMLPSSPSSRRWQASLELSVRPWRWGSATGHPQGPISAGVPRKGPSNDPRRRCCNRAIAGPYAHPPIDHMINSAARHFWPCVFWTPTQSCSLVFLIIDFPSGRMENAHPGSRHQNEHIGTLTMGEKLHPQTAPRAAAAGRKPGPVVLSFCIISSLPSQRVAVTVSHMMQGK